MLLSNLRAVCVQPRAFARLSVVESSAGAAWRRLAIDWRAKLATPGVVTVLFACLSASALFITHRHAPVPLKRFSLHRWDGAPPPAAPAATSEINDGVRYYLSRGPVVYLIEEDVQRDAVRRAWVWRLEDAESLDARWAPAVSKKWVVVADLHGDVVAFERATGRSKRLVSTGLLTKAPRFDGSTLNLVTRHRKRQFDMP